MDFHRIRVMLWIKLFFRSTHIAEQHLFLCFLQYLLLMLSNLWVVLAFFWLGSGSEIVLGSTHIVQQLLFSMFPSILTFDLFFTFWGPKGLLLDSM